MISRRGSRNPAMVVDYADDLRLLPTAWAKAGVVAAALVWLAAPMNLTDYQLSILTYAGIAAIGALGLNLLTGYTGQVSLGHAFFLAVGAYGAGWSGAEHGFPIAVWLPLAAVMGGVLGAVIGPFALRLRGNYLAIVTLGMVFVGGHVWENWDSVTGGNTGRSVSAALPTLARADFDLLGTTYTRDQGFFWLVWALVAVAVVIARNIVRSRPGRAMQAIRDRDLAAEIIGVRLATYKVGAFAVSSAFAAGAGALLGTYTGYVSPADFGLLLSIQYIAIIIVGGVGTVFGSVLGALVLGAAPQMIQTVSLNNDLPFVSGDKGGADGVIAVASLNQMIFGFLIVLFLVVEPRGLAAVWFRTKAYFRSWPFSY